ncbi:MAG: hypothetical protein ABI166_07920 [Mucilaginibacter sp.]
MPNHLSVLGIIHTAISVIALITGIVALFRDGKIDPGNTTGKSYILLTVITCLTSLPIMKTGHLTTAHYVAVVILVLLPIGMYAGRIFGRAAAYIQMIVMSTTLFLSSIPAIVETLTRLPISKPIANGANDPLIQKALSCLALIYFTGVLYQLFILKTKKKTEQNATVKLS